LEQTDSQQRHISLTRLQRPNKGALVADVFERYECA
jgi:hypothetical protein